MPTGNKVDLSFNNILAKTIHLVQSFVLPFMRPIDTGSFGRIVCTFLLFISYYYSWRLSKDIPATLLTVLEAMLLYVFGSKVYTGITDIKKAHIANAAAANVAASSDADTATDDVASNK